MRSSRLCRTHARAGRHLAHVAGGGRTCVATAQRSALQGACSPERRQTPGPSALEPMTCTGSRCTLRHRYCESGASRPPRAMVAAPDVAAATGPPAVRPGAPARRQADARSPSDGRRGTCSDQRAGMPRGRAEAAARRQARLIDPHERAFGAGLPSQFARHVFASDDRPDRSASERHLRNA
jgi:hypothetical protein